MMRYLHGFGIRFYFELNNYGYERERIRFHVFALNSAWFIALFKSVVIGQSNYIGFGFTTLN